MKRDHSLYLLCLCETWHDTDSVSICRLRAEGLQVLERARQRPTDTRPSLTTNHGGVALAASRGVKLTAINTGGRVTHGRLRKLYNMSTSGVLELGMKGH